MAIMITERDSVFDLLYMAKMNIPEAAKALGMPASESSWEDLKEQFRDWALAVTGDGIEPP